MQPTRSDFILIAAALVTAILLGMALLFLRPLSDGRAAEITIDGHPVATLPLDTDTTLTLPTGHIVEVKDGAVSVTSAPCRDRICQNTPSAGRAGDTIVCLPCKVVITVTVTDADAKEGGT